MLTIHVVVKLARSSLHANTNAVSRIVISQHRREGSLSQSSPAQSRKIAERLHVYSCLTDKYSTSVC